MSVPAMAAEVYFSDAVPNTTASQPSLTANNNPLNTPPSPGAISVPQSPSGTSVTNTGRSAVASQTMAAAGLTGNPLRGWNGVLNPNNKFS